MTTPLAFIVTWRDQGAKAGMNDLAKGADKAEKKFSKFKGAAVAGGAIAGAAILQFGKSSVTAFVEAEQSQVKLQDAYRKFPSLANVSISAMQEFNSELAKKTQYDDDAYAAGQATLAQYGLTGTQLQQLTPLVADYAAKTGKTLPDAAKSVGKAFTGSSKALKEVGLNMKMSGDKTRDFAAIMGGLNSKVGGFAENQGKSAAGQAAILKNQFGEIQEEVGSKLVPILITLGTHLLKVIEFIQKNSAVIGPMVAIIGSAAAIIFVVVKATQAWTAVQAAMNVVLTMNPIGLVVAAIALLVVGLIIAYKKSDTFRAIVQGAFKAVTAAGKAMWNGLKAAFQFMKTGFQQVYVATQMVAAKIKLAFLQIALAVGRTVEKILSVFAKIPGPVGAAFAKARDAVRSSNASMQASVNASKARVDALNAAARRIRSKTVTITVNTRMGQNQNATSGRAAAYAFTGQAKGGVYEAGQAFWVGERGPELRVEPRGGRTLSHADSIRAVQNRRSGGGGDTIIVNLSGTAVVGSNREFRDLVVAAVREAKGRGRQ